MDESSAGRDRSQEPDWSELPPEILLWIGKRLENRIDFCKVRSVCKNWRSSLPLPKNPNLLNPLLPLHFLNDMFNPLPFTQQWKGIFHLVATTVFLVQPLNSNPNSESKSWILTVEEREPGRIQLLYPLSRNQFSDKYPTFPKSLNLDEFRVSEIGKGYHFLVPAFLENVFSESKVVLCLNNSAENFRLSTVDNCLAIVLYPNGNLIRLSWRNGGQIIYVDKSVFSRFKDILWMKGMLYAIDDKGKLHVVDHRTLKVIKTIVNHPICYGNVWIRLVDWSDIVYVVVINEKKIYKLNQIQNKWVEIKTLGNRILFLGLDYCFMVSTNNLLQHKGDFVIYNVNVCKALHFKGMYTTGKDLGINMYCFRADVTTESENDASLASCVAISSSLWPPPPWFWNGANNLQLDHPCHCYLNSHNKAITPSLQANNQPQRNVEICKSVASKVKFEGVDIRCDMVPVLQKIWVRYGNVVEGSSVRSKDMLKYALKLLAKAVTILESSSGRTLSKLQCDDLSSILVDLKQLQVRVIWLEPYVNKAVKLQQSKLMVDALEDLEKKIVKTKEMKMRYSKTLAGLEVVEKELEKDKTLVSKKIPFVGRVDLDQCVGDGLF